MTIWRITGGNPRAEETAALTVVLTALLAGRVASAEAAATEDSIAPSGWQRAHSNPHRAAGTWRSR